MNGYLKFMGEMLDGIKRHSRERLRQLEEDVQANRQEAEETKESLAKIQRGYEQLRVFSSLAEQFFTSVLANFYPLILEASERTKGTYSRCFRGKRVDLLTEFDKSFLAGRNFGPVPPREREQLAFYLGSTGQLLLDITFMAELSTRLPLDMLREAERQPDMDVGKLFDLCFERLKDALSSELSSKWSTTPSWAAEVLDHFIQQATDEARSEPLTP